jgi:ribosome-associated toxin RatA of RatAB toxin-antitoxin module
MKKLTITKTLPFSAEYTYERLSDFSLFEEVCSAVISVEVNSVNENETLSNWTVHFHDGEMQWQERDVFNKEKLCIEFEQTEGDAEEFNGSWQVNKLGTEQCEVVFSAEFCMGIPSLADILEPIAEQAISQNINQMLEQMFVQQAA